MTKINKEIILTQEYIKSIFDYHHDGYLTWKILSKMNLNGKAVIGQRAGWSFTHHSGIRNCVRINKKTFYTSRIIFLWCNGWLPEVVDHKDRDTQNEKIDNLRASDNAKNSRNRTSQKNTTSQYLGVCFMNKTTRRIIKTTGEMGIWNYAKWVAQITIDGKRKLLGRFSTEAEAAIAYNNAAKLHYGEFANLNIIKP